MNRAYSKCWASYREDCDRGMSAEHLLSKALFADQKLYASGFDWCATAERRIGINALRRRFLCAKHNNDLSPADEAGVQAVSAFATGTTENALRGPLLERWLLKTAINLSVGGELHIGSGMTDSTPGWPSPYLLAVAFGDLLFSAKMGIYFLIPRSSYVHRAGEILVVPLHRDGAIGGFLFGLRGQFVFLNLYPGHAPSTIGTLAPGLLPPPLDGAELVYRPNLLSLRIGDGDLRHIGIQWL